MTHVAIWGRGAARPGLVEFMACALLVGPAPIAWAAWQEPPSFKEQAGVDDFQQAMTEGIDAFRRSQLGAATQAFERAYLIRPNDPKLQSWLSLVRDQQARWAAMSYAVEDVRALRAQAEAAEGPAKEPVEPGERPSFWKPLFLPKPVPLQAGLTPAQGSRPEILEAGKRAGFQRLYKEGIGFQPVPGLGFSARTEIFEEPNPVEDFILEGKIENWDSLSEQRRAIMPLFTRSWALRAVADYEPWPRLTYEFDKRDILHELQARFNVKDRDLETHAVNALYTFYNVAFVEQLTVNPWYKRIFQESSDDPNSFEDKDEFILNLSTQPTPNVEYFFQYDTFESVKTKSIGASRGKLFKGQVRLRFPSLKLFAIPSFEYSDTDYDPSDDELVKRDYFIDWGFDVTKRLRASSIEQFVTLDLQRAGNVPSNPEAHSFATKNTLSYELFRDFDVSLGFDHARGVGVNAYDNVGLRAELELFKPGVIRAKVGYEWVSYYNIDDDLSLLYFKLFLFQ